MSHLILVRIKLFSLWMIKIEQLGAYIDEY